MLVSVRYRHGNLLERSKRMSDNYLAPLGSNQSVDLDELLQQDSTILKIYAGRLDTPPIVLARLACHSDETIRKYVAQNNSTPGDILAVLSEDSEWSVRYAVASNESTPQSVLKRIIERDSYDIAYALRNANSPLESILYHMLVKIPENEKAALGFNSRFASLIRLAANMDAEAAQAVSSELVRQDQDGSVREADIWS